MSTDVGSTALLDWRGLRAEIVPRIATATTTGRPHWQRLLDLVDQRLVATPDDAGPPTAGRRWWLTEVRIEGFRGVPDTFELRLHPDPGLTVLHGPNGTGKSTVSDAVHAALHGEPAQQPRELWRPVDRAVGAARARVEVRLHEDGAGGELLTCVWGDDPAPDSTATLRSDGRERAVSVRDADWQAVLSAYTPVFSYAQTQDRLGTPEALAQHLDDLLALGPCFAQLRQDAAEQATTAKTAAAELQTVKRAAKLAVTDIDARYADDTEPALPPVDFPNQIGVAAPDAWLARNGLDTDAISAPDHVTTEDIDAVERAATTMRDTLERLDHVETHLDTVADARMHLPLVELHDAIAHDPPAGPCPVCGAQAGWWPVLTDTARELRQWSEVRREIDTAARRLRDVHRDQVRPILAVATALGMSTDELGVNNPPPDRGRTAVERAALTTVVTALLGAPFARLVEEVRRRGEHEHRWQAARRDAVEEFTRAWRELGPTAVTTTDWTQAGAKLTGLRKELRDARGDELGVAVGDVLNRLLSDTALTLDGVQFTGGDALRIVGGDDRPRSLGMLSAGQRNALVLAPLLRAQAGGPFGFLIVDDPVHAFDDMRIDLVSDELIRLSAQRRVVVLTHDTRLTEVLLAKRPDADVRTLTRKGDAVTAVAGTTPWLSLLKEAAELLELGDKADLPAGLGRLPVLVRGMCRHAVEGALRGLALRWAVLAHASLRDTVRALDRAGMTRPRFSHATRFELPGRPGPAADARALCEGYLNLWNAATHDTGGSTSAGLSAEVRAARKACELLDAWGRS